MKRLKMTMLTCVLATVLTTLVLAPKVAGAASLTCGTWSVVSSPNVGQYNELDGVAAVSASNGWTVGYYRNGKLQQTLIEHWNGTSWSVVPSPNVGLSDNFLYGVAAVSASKVWAVGYYVNTTSNVFQTLIEQWNGTSWSVVPSPNVGSGSNQLYGVAAVSASKVWAVGYYQNSSSNVFQTLIEQWNGTSWSVVPSPNVGSSDNDLYGVARVPGTSKVWTVGHYQNTSSNVYQTLIEQWNGTSWSVVPSPNVGSSYNYLVGVAAVSASNVWTVGSYFNTSSNVTQTMIDRWNGTSWSAVPSPNVGSRYNDLNGVAAVSASNVWAVGYYYTGGINQTLIEQWNGTSWSVVPSPNVGFSDNDLFGVARVGTSSKVWSVGAYFNTSSNAYQTLTEFYC